MLLCKINRFCSWASGFYCLLAWQASEVICGKFLKKFKLQKYCKRWNYCINFILNYKINHASKNFSGGLVGMTFSLVHHSYSLPKGQAWKGVFFAPWYSYIVQSPSGWDATGLMFSNNHLQYDYSLCKLTNGIWVLNNENGQIYCFNLYCAACLDQTFF